MQCHARYVERVYNQYTDTRVIRNNYEQWASWVSDDP